jgi:hypothetical protein
MKKRVKRTELITFRLSRTEREDLLEGPAEEIGCPNSDLIRMALRQFSLRRETFQRQKPLGDQRTY